MTAYRRTVRATHLLTDAAWLGGSLGGWPVGAVTLTPGASLVHCS